MKNADQPAYPSEFEGPEKDEFGMPLIVHRKCYGLTKRELIAAMIASGKNGDPKQIAEHAIWVADELLKQLETK